MKQNESKGQVRESEIGTAYADLFREMETGHPPDQEVASFVRIERGEQIQYGIVVNLGSKVPPQSEIPRGPDISPRESSEDKMYVDVYNPLVDYFADVVIIAKQENGQIVPGPKLTVTLPYSIIKPIEEKEKAAILNLGYFFLYHLIGIQDRSLLILLSHIPEKLKDNPSFDRRKYLAAVVDLLTSLNIDITRADIREMLGALASEGIGVVCQQEKMRVEIITFPQCELKSGDIVAIRDFQSNLITIAIVVGSRAGKTEAQLELQREMDGQRLELASRPINRGAIIDKNVNEELIEVSRPRGPPNAVRIEIGNIYGTNLPFQLELIPGRNNHCALAAISEGGKSNTVKVVAYQAIRNRLPLGMMIFDEHGEYTRSGEDFALDKLDPSTYILADPFSDPESRVPLDWIPLERLLEGTTSAQARPAFRRILQLYYRGPGNADLDKPNIANRLSVSALNWILERGNGKELKKTFREHFNNDLLAGVADGTIDIIIRELRNLTLKRSVIQIEYDEEADKFSNIFPRQEVETQANFEKRREHLLKKVYSAQKNAKVMVLDASAITNTEAKLWLKRLVLDNVVNDRQSEYRRNKEGFEKDYKLFMFVFEEATAAFDEETMGRIKEYRDFAVQARKFFCGYMPVMQDPETLDPTMLNQLQNNIILKIPQDDLRKEMFRRLPCDATPFDSFIATASPGQGIVVNPVKKGFGNLPIPVKIHYLNDLILRDLNKAIEEHKKNADEIVKRTKLSKDFVESYLTGNREVEGYENKY